MPKAVEDVLNDAGALWAVYNSGKLVLGPWESAEVPGRVSHGKESMWRLRPQVLSAHWMRESDHGALVCKSQPLEEPELHDFMVWGGYDEDAFQKAHTEWEHERAAWGPWSWSVDRIDGAQRKGYAATREEAQRLADEVLTACGVLLCGPVVSVDNVMED